MRMFIHHRRCVSQASGSLCLIRACVEQGWVLQSWALWQSMALGLRWATPLKWVPLGRPSKTGMQQRLCTVNGQYLLVFTSKSSREALSMISLACA